MYPVYTPKVYITALVDKKKWALYDEFAQRKSACRLHRQAQIIGLFTASMSANMGGENLGMNAHPIASRFMRMPL